MKNDLISRQAAIDVAIDAINEWGGGWDAEREVRDAINALPSAQTDLQPTCNNLATDCISRQEVLDWLNDEWDGMVLSVFDGIRALPSVQPEIIYCKDCLHNGSFDTDCPIEWNGKEYCSFAERRTDERSVP